jgi:hypothetical protein
MIKPAFIRAIRKKYQVHQDFSDKEGLVYETDNFLEALKEAKRLAIKGCDKMIVTSIYKNSDMHIVFDPIGRQSLE